MKIAVIGGGVSGISAAWALAKSHQVSLYEKEHRLGGHTHTHALRIGGRDYRIDSGFIVHNTANYPLFSAFLRELGVETEETEMSFSVHDRATGMYYNARDFSTLFAQKRNLLSADFWRMLWQIRRFYRECPALLDSPADGPSLDDYLKDNGYSRYFADNHLIPMASALWSSPSRKILDFPAKYLVSFMANHHMLQVSGRPQWRVLRNGSSTYIEAACRQWNVQVRTGAAIREVRRFESHVDIDCGDNCESYDHVVFACHSDQTLRLLAEPTTAECDILGAIRYQDNETILHGDRSVLPPDKRAWAAWNADIPGDPDAPCTVSYCMNILQGLDSPHAFIVSLNQRHLIDPELIHAQMHYRHPVYDHAMVRAQARRHELQGRKRSWFCGAYWGFGFHEDGFRSGLDVATAIMRE